MRKIIFLSLVVSIIFLFQCTTNTMIQSEYSVSDAIILGNDDILDKYKFDRYRLNNLYVNGDSLTINLSYSGGCRKHDFNLIAKKYFENDKQVNATLLLSHDAKQDPCEAYPTEDHTFNLLPLKFEYFKKYGKESGSITLILEESEILYNF